MIMVCNVKKRVKAFFFLLLSYKTIFTFTKHLQFVYRLYVDTRRLVWYNKLDSKTEAKK